MKKLFAILLATSQCWGALTFANASTDKVNCGSGAAIDDINVGTIMTWYRPTSVSNNNRYILSKDVPGFSGYYILYQRSSDGSSIGFQKHRATTVLNANTNTGVAVANTWTYLAITYDATVTTTPAPTWYKGTLASPASDVTNATGLTAGTGAAVTDASNDLFLGNHSSTGTVSTQGSIAMVHWVNYKMGLGEIIGQQYRPRPVVGTVFYAQLITTANFSDLSGNAHACVVTGATISDHVPTGPWFGFNIRRFLGIDYENITPNTIFAD